MKKKFSAKNLQIETMGEKALLLFLGLMMNENGGAKRTTPDLLHDLVLIHTRLHRSALTFRHQTNQRETSASQIAI